MRFALDENNNRVRATEEAKKVECFCQRCGEKVVPKVGKIRVHHFAHASNSECPYNKDKDYKSEWHMRMQDYFPFESQEYRFVDAETNEIHIADVFDEKTKTVIEFQHSPISPEEFISRTAFHINNGRRIVWVFDESSEGETQKCRFKDDDLGYSKYPYQTQKWIRSRRCLNFGLNIEQYAQRYSVCVYYGTESDIVHRIVREYKSFKYIDVSFRSIEVKQGMNVDEFFIPDGYWQTVEPYKSIFDKYIAEQKRKLYQVYSTVPRKTVVKRNFHF